MCQVRACVCKMCAGVCQVCHVSVHCGPSVSQVCVKCVSSVGKVFAK